jgi:hypothetical protein
MTANIPNAFVQTDIDDKNHIKGQQIIMKIRGPLIDMLVKIKPKVLYEDFVVCEGKDKVLYIKMLRAIIACYSHPYSITRSFERILSPLDLKSIHMIPVLPTKLSKASSTQYLGMSTI